MGSQILEYSTIKYSTIEYSTIKYSFHRIYLRHRISEDGEHDTADQHAHGQGPVIAGFDHEKARYDAADYQKIVGNNVLQRAKKGECGDYAEQGGEE